MTSSNSFTSPIAVSYTHLFGSNEALVIDDIQDCCLYKLSFHDRCYNFDKRFSWAVSYTHLCDLQHVYEQSEGKENIGS